MTAPFGADAPIEEPPVDPASPDATEAQDADENQVTHWEPEPEPGDQPVDDAPEGEPQPAVDEGITPVTVRHGREDIEIEGALMAPEGMYVPKDALDKTLRLIQRGIHHERTYDVQQRGWQQQVQRERAEAVRQSAIREVTEAEAAAYTKELQSIFKDEDSFLAFAENYSHNLELLRARVELAKNAAVTGAMKKGIDLDTPANESTAEERNQQAAAALIENFDDICSQGELATLLPTEAEQDAVFKLILRSPTRYIERAPYDMPAIDVRKGELVVNRETLANDIKGFASFRGPQAPTRADKINTAVQKAPTRPKPSTPRPASAASPESSPKTEAEWRRRLIRMARTG